MNLTRTILDVIDMRSFSSLWYWIMLAVIWSSASHWVLGVPWDMIQRARRDRGAALDDLVDLVRVNVGRILHIAEEAGLFLAGFAAFFLTGLLALGFLYDVEFAQAVVLIALPLTIVGGLSIHTSRRLVAMDPDADQLFRGLARHRFLTQLIGMAAIFVTAMYGMYHNLAVVEGF